MLIKFNYSLFIFEVFIKECKCYFRIGIKSFFLCFMKINFFGILNLSVWMVFDKYDL